MKMIIALAFVLAAGAASATELPVPGKGKQPVATSPPVVVPLAGTREACLRDVAVACDAKNWTRLGKFACYRVKKRACR